MPPKKNGFYYLMLEVQQREAEKGTPCTLAAAQHIADPIWKSLTPAEKQKYNEKAKRGNEVLKNDLSQKFTSLGVSFAAIDSQERAKTEALNLMTNNIKRTVGELHSKDKLRSNPFFLVHVNHYFQTEDNYYAPAEFALAVFSFEKGLIETLHFFIHIGKIPLGYKSSAQERTLKIHSIPFLDSTFKDALKDYEEMYWMVSDFIQRHSPNQMPPLYTMTNSLTSNYSDSAVQCALDNMCQAANVDSSMFKVYHLDKLFFEIISKVRPNEFCSSALMRNEIEKDPFSYAMNLGCYFHEETETLLNCSLSMVVRWVFTLCDHICRHLNVKLKLGVHVPKEVDVNWKQRNASNIDHNKPLSFVETDLREEPRNRNDSYCSEASRPTRSLLSKKIGARFETTDTSGLSSALDTASEADYSTAGAGSDADDSDWSTVECKKYGMGRGKLIPKSGPVKNMLPTSGRGRIASLKK